MVYLKIRPTDGKVNIRNGYINMTLRLYTYGKSVLELFSRLIYYCMIHNEASILLLVRKNDRNSVQESKG